MIIRQRTSIWLKTAAIAALYLFTIWFVHKIFFSKPGSTPTIAWIFSFSISQAAFIISLLALVMTSRLVTQIRNRRKKSLYVLIREPLASHAMGVDRLADLKQMYLKHSHEVGECLVEFLPSITGLGRERLCRLAEDLGLIDAWKANLKSWDVKTRRRAIGWLTQVTQFVEESHFVAALDDIDETVRLRASRALAKTQDPNKLSLAFAQATNQPLLLRALLVEDLRPFAQTLAQEVIPTSLAAADPQVVIGTLEVINAWGKALPLQMPAQLLRHAHPEIRSKALLALPFMTGQPNIQDEIQCALEEGDQLAQVAAAKVAARMKMTNQISPLVRCVRGSNFEAAFAAAFALASLGPEGLAALRKEVLSTNRLSASVAFEAYERATIKRLER